MILVLMVVVYKALALSKIVCLLIAQPHVVAE